MLTIVPGALACGAAAHAATVGGAAAVVTVPGSTDPALPAGDVPAGPTPPPTGGQVYDLPDPAATPTVPGFAAQILPNGAAAAPALAPPSVQQVIWAANRIIGKPYAYGGGHTRSLRLAEGYDCSGTVSFALRGGGLLTTPLDSSKLMRWGRPGAGTWITVYSNRGHAYMTIAGLRLDTSPAADPSRAKGPRWRPLPRSSRGYKTRHPIGL